MIFVSICFLIVFFSFDGFFLCIGVDSKFFGFFRMTGVVILVLVVRWRFFFSESLEWG